LPGLPATILLGCRTAGNRQPSFADGFSISSQRFLGLSQQAT
jgi:hypothetical protein